MNFYQKIAGLFWLAALTAIPQLMAEGFTLEEQVPDRTVLFASAPNIEKTREAFLQTSLSKAAQEQEIQELIKTLLSPYEREINGALAQVKQQVGMSIPELLEIFSGEFAIAVVDLDPSNPNMPVAAVASLQFGDNKDKVGQLFELANAMGAMPPFSKEEYQQIELFSSPAMPISYAFVDQSLVVSTKIELLKEVIDNSRSETRENLLHTSSNYKLAKEKIQSTSVPSLFCFVNIEKLLQQFGGMVPPPAQEMAKSLGIDDIKSLSFGTNFYKEYWHEAIFLQADVKEGFLSLFDAEAVSPAVYKEIPANSVVFSVGHSDSMAFVARLEGLIKAIGPMLPLPPGQDAFAMYEQMSGQLNQMLGFSIKNDLLASLGTDHYTFSYMPPEGGLWPRSVQAITLKDQQRFHKCLDSLAKLVQLEIKETTCNGTKFSYLVNPVGELGSNPFSNLESGDPMEAVVGSLGYSLSGLCFMYEDDKVYLTNGGQDMKGFIRDRETWKEDITQNPDFQKLQAVISPDSSAVIYVDIRPMFNSLWNTAMPIVRSLEGTARAFGIPLETALLPRSTTISKHLNPGVMTYTTNADGIHISVYSSLGGGVPVVAIAGVAAAVAIPNMNEAQVQSNEASAIGTLRSLSTAQVQFQQMAMVDQDEDGIGEYGYIQELTGQSNLRGQKRIADPPFFSPSFTVDANGVAEKNGYRFYCYLPGKDAAVGEGNGVKVTEDQGAVDNQELRFVVYAWPVKPGGRVFAVDQTGEVMSTTPSMPYSRFNIPTADAMYEPTGDTANLEGRPAYGSRGVDGNVWGPAW